MLTEENVWDFIAALDFAGTVTIDTEDEILVRDISATDTIYRTSIDNIFQDMFGEAGNKATPAATDRILISNAAYHDLAHGFGLCHRGNLHGCPDT